MISKIYYGNIYDKITDQECDENTMIKIYEIRITDENYVLDDWIKVTKETFLNNSDVRVIFIKQKNKTEMLDVIEKS